MKIIMLTIILLTISLTSFGASPKLEGCYEIKYLDFFKLEKMEPVKWSQSEIDKLMEEDFNKGESDINRNFIIPALVYQLNEYNPSCKAEIDTVYFNNILGVYLKIRNIDAKKLLNHSIEEKNYFLRDDFYSQVENVNYLPKMIMTFDDGPFYGEDVQNNLKLNVLYKQETEFGTLIVSKIDDKMILTSKNKSGEIIWQKTITGLLNRNLSSLAFTENPMEYNSVATVVHMYSQGERLTLYLKNDGEFMFYFHSW